MESIKTWILSRLKEPTTWAGLTALLTGVGVTIAPELSEVIVSAGVSIGSLLAILLGETK